MHMRSAEELGYFVKRKPEIIKRLPVIDVSQNLNDRLPDVFVPAFGANLPLEKANYCCFRTEPVVAEEVRYDAFRLVALRDFSTAMGRRVEAGTLGGIMDCKSHLSHDGSWIEENSVMLAGVMTGRSFLGGESVLCHARLKNSLVTEKSLIYQSWCEEAIVKRSDIRESCSATASLVENSRFRDRVHVYGSASPTQGSGRLFLSCVSGCDLRFVHASDCILRHEKLSGEATQAKKLHQYVSGSGDMQRLLEAIWENVENKTPKPGRKKDGFWRRLKDWFGNQR